jgi:hypothetical protein
MSATTAATTAAPVAVRPTTRQKVGLGLAGFYFVTNLPSVFEAAPAGKTGPPMSVMAVDSALALIGIVATVLAWRTMSRRWTGTLAAALVVTTLTSVPGLFVDVPAFVKALVAAGIVWTLVVLVLVFSGPRDAC